SDVHWCHLTRIVIPYTSSSCTSSFWFPASGSRRRIQGREDLSRHLGNHFDGRFLEGEQPDQGREHDGADDKTDGEKDPPPPPQLGGGHHRPRISSGLQPLQFQGMLLFHLIAGQPAGKHAWI